MDRELNSDEYKAIRDQYPGLEMILAEDVPPPGWSDLLLCAAPLGSEAEEADYFNNETNEQKSAQLEKIRKFNQYIYENYETFLLKLNKGELYIKKISKNEGKNAPFTYRGIGFERFYFIIIPEIDCLYRESWDYRHFVFFRYRDKLRDFLNFAARCGLRKVE